MFEEWEFHDITPVYLQLADKLRYGILSGKIGIGHKLPSYRQLAKQLRINPATVQKAYRCLVTEQLLIKSGEGFFVLPDENTIQLFRLDKEQSFVCQYLSRMTELGYSRTEAICKVLVFMNRMKEPPSNIH